MFPQKHLYYCSIGLVRPANQGKNIFFQLQSQNMHHAVKYNMHYTMSTYSADLFWVHNIFLNVVPVLNAFAIWFALESEIVLQHLCRQIHVLHKISVARKDRDINALLVVTSETMLSTIERESQFRLFSLSLTIFISLSIPIVSNIHSRLDFAPL